MLCLLVRIAALGQCAPGTRPNILLCITDDQSWESTSAAGNVVVRTPTFDRVAREGVYFKEAYVGVPSCTPSRGVVLTGRNAYALKDGAIHSRYLPTEFATYQDLLENVGYRVGYTGKGVEPGLQALGGRTRNPAGPAYNTVQFLNADHPAGVSRIDYAGNFRAFLKGRQEGQPFSFWYGAFEPHRGYGGGLGVQRGMDPAKVKVPDFLPKVNNQLARELCDYYYEVEWADTQLGKMMALLDSIGELENTLIIITSDNGMPYPRAKVDLYEYGVHVPLAMRIGSQSMRGGRTVTDFVSLVDLAPTILDLAGVAIPGTVQGRSLMPVLQSAAAGRVDPRRDMLVTAHERHGDFGMHPKRAIYTDQYIYIYNSPCCNKVPEPDTPALANHLFEAMKEGLIVHHLVRKFRNHPQIKPYWQMYLGDRPERELFIRSRDPYQLFNVADDPAYAHIADSLHQVMNDYLLATDDPRARDPNTPYFHSLVHFSGKWQQANPQLVQENRNIIYSNGGPEWYRPAAPVAAPAYVSLRDNNGTPGYIGGKLTWQPAHPGKHITFYKIVYLDSQRNIIEPQIATICAGTSGFDFPDLSELPPEARYIAVMAANDAGFGPPALLALPSSMPGPITWLFPNPNSGSFQLVSHWDQHKELDIRVVSKNGQTVWQQRYTCPGVPCEAPVNIPRPAAGVYAVEVRGNNFHWVKKVVIF
ncbi:MAG: hypothetical protein OHK0039_13340 [Bacteroidia bacterium]